MNSIFIPVSFDVLNRLLHGDQLAAGNLGPEQCRFGYTCAVVTAEALGVKGLTPGRQCRARTTTE